MTPAQFAAATAVMAIGSLLQGSIGFGVALFAAPFLALIDPTLAPAPLLVANFTLTLLMARREWTSVRTADLGWSLGGRVIGIGIALAVLRTLSPPGVDLLFGVIVLAAVVMAAAGPGFRVDPRTLVGAGITSGLMGTTTAIGGPPMAIVYQREAGPRIRGTLSAYFAVGAVMSALGLAVVGRFGLADLGKGLLLCPGVAVGFAGSHRLLPLVDRKGIRPALLAVSGAAAIVLILRRVL